MVIVKHQNQNVAGLEKINLQPAERALLIGTTQSGKSTLAERLIAGWTTRSARSRTFIIDTKPRFKAMWDMNGTYASWRYRKWREGAFVPYSYRLPEKDLLREDHWHIARTTTPKDRGLIIIAQTDDVDYYPWLDYQIRMFYRQASKKVDLYLYVDEMRSFFGGKPTLQKGTVQCIVSGAEKGIGFLGATQRPKFIPNEAMSEMSKLYCFRFDYLQDLKKLHDMGVPTTFLPPEDVYYFRYYDKRSRESGLKILQL